MMSHSMKEQEKVIEKRQFMPGKLTIEPIFRMRQIVEKYSDNKREMCKKKKRYL